MDQVSDEFEVVYDLSDIRSVLRHLELEGETRAEEIIAEGNRLARTLKHKFRVALNNLPKYVRDMSLEELVGEYKGSIENARQRETNRMKQDFNTWVKDVHTPRRTSRAQKKSIAKTKSRPRRSRSTTSISSNSSAKDVEKQVSPVKRNRSLRSSSVSVAEKSSEKNNTKAKEKEKSSRRTRSSSRMLKRLEQDMIPVDLEETRSTRRSTRSSTRLSRSRSAVSSKEDNSEEESDQNVQIRMRNNVKSKLMRMEPKQREKVEKIFSGMEAQLNSLLDELN